MVEFVMPGMSCLVWEHDQVVKTVVVLVLVVVMDDFTFLQVSAQRSLSHSAVDVNICSGNLKIGAGLSGS